MYVYKGIYIYIYILTFETDVTCIYRYCDCRASSILLVVVNPTDKERLQCWGRVERDFNLIFRAGNSIKNHFGVVSFVSINFIIIINSLNECISENYIDYKFNVVRILYQ